MAGDGSPAYEFIFGGGDWNRTSDTAGMNRML